MKNFTIFFHSHSHKIFFYLFLIAFFCQILFWFDTKNIKPNYDIVPTPPNQYFLKGASLGDSEFLFRILSLRIQNSGDVFAGFSSLKNYDYSRLYQWFVALDSLNEKSNLIPALSTYYFAQTANNNDLQHIMNYLDFHNEKNIDANWWWIFQEIMLAQKNLHDDKLALKLAYKLSQNNAKDAPLWTKEMPAFIHAKLGNSCMAFKIIQKILEENERGTRKISADEMNFMRHFINERLTKLKGEKFDPNKCNHLTKI